MVAVRAVQEGLAPLAVMDRGLEGAADTRPRLSVQETPAAREPIFQVTAGGGNRKTTSGQDPSVCKSVPSSLDPPPPTSITHGPQECLGPISRAPTPKPRPTTGTAPLHRPRPLLQGFQVPLPLTRQERVYTLLLGARARKGSRL